MDLMALIFPFSDPGSRIAVHLGPLSVRWYGLAYMAGLLLGWLYMRHLCRKQALWMGESPMQPYQADDFLIWATLGTVVGGRVGWFLFYGLLSDSNEVRHWYDVFLIWNGGMSFHGGLLGVGLAAYLFARRNGVPVLSLMDLSAAVVPFGLFFGRLANFVNGELYGRVTSVSWGMVYPLRMIDCSDRIGPEQLCTPEQHNNPALTDPSLLAEPRHPSQLYEAFLEGIVLFAILRYLTHRTKSLASPGLTTGVFLVAYSVFRIIVERFRQPDEQHFLNTLYVTEGMVYSLPMIALGVYFIKQASAGGTSSSAQQKA